MSHLVNDDYARYASANKEAVKERLEQSLSEVRRRYRSKLARAGLLHGVLLRVQMVWVRRQVRLSERSENLYVAREHG